MFVRSQRGVIGTIDLSWTIHKESPWYVSVYGSAGTLNVGWQSSQYRHDGSAGCENLLDVPDRVRILERRVVAGPVPHQDDVVVVVDDARNHRSPVEVDDLGLPRSVPPALPTSASGHS
jgi:hypothetical protein